MLAFVLQHQIPIFHQLFITFVILRQPGIDLAIDYVSIYGLNGICSNPTWALFRSVSEL